MKIIEIFKSIQGEGTRSGLITTFVRFYGCNLNCSWCDTKYSFDENQVVEMSEKEIIGQINKFKSKNLCVTGGEPLILNEKLYSFLDSVFVKTDVNDVAIETNGSVSVKELCSYRKKLPQKISIIMDYKLESSGVSEYMQKENFLYLSDTDEIKFVVASKNDFIQAKEVITDNYRKGIILFSPVINLYSPAKLAEDLLSYKKNYDFRYSLQMHKFIWPKENKGR